MISSKPTNPLPNPPLSALEALLAARRPTLDVRAETEFEQGALPNSANVPILNDKERARVGTTYKQQGSEAAQKVGHRLVSGDVRHARVAAWQKFVEDNPDALLICWRGGMRSQIAEQWLQEIGMPIERVLGGYKSLRQTCIHVLEHRATTKDWFVLAGQTGTAKTVVINQSTNSIDLEGVANHRGSAFGARLSGQPSPATFENQLAVDFLAHTHASLLVEDESRTIGRLALPETWHQQMQTAPLILLEANQEFRIEHIREEYVVQPLKEGEPAYHLARRYSDALDRIARRLGGVNHREIKLLLEEAFEDKRPHEDWIASLLARYYDPMYDFQLKKKEKRIIFRGNHASVYDFLSDRGHGAEQPKPHHDQ